ncbi:MAG: serine/threonine-protein kinase [Persicimonas sp.]
MFINRKLGEYVLLRRLAVGGQSEVFLAVKEGPDDFTRPLVIKALPTEYRHDPTFVELFYREAFLSARFSHPNVITVHDAKRLRGDHCMIMDYLAGKTVAEFAQRAHRRGEPLTLEMAIQIVADACAGLHYTHRFRDLDQTRYSVVHRDVSPQNLMVTYQGLTKVFDFGIAKIQEEDGGEETLAGGKYAYMSPEQCREERVDARSDIFSLGVILYELTVGRRLFRRDSTEETIAAVTGGDIPTPTSVNPNFPRALEPIVMRALERDPKDRYQSAERLRDDLIETLGARFDGKLRRRVGAHCAELFAEERADIARTLNRAREENLDPRPVGDIPLEKLGREDVSVDEAEPEVPMPEPERDKDLAAQLDEKSAGSNIDPQSIKTAKEKNERLAAEVTRLQRRQTLLVAVLLAMALAAAGFAFYSNSAPSEDEGEPIEIGDTSE